VEQTVMFTTRRHDDALSRRRGQWFHQDVVQSGTFIGITTDERVRSTRSSDVCCWAHPDRQVWPMLNGIASGRR